MKGESHIVLGAAAGAALHLAVPYLPAGVLPLSVVIGVNVVGSLLPDIDSDESIIRQATGTNRRSGCLGWIVSLGFSLFGGHRAITHSLIALGLVAGLARWAGQPWALAFAVGYAAHLLADMLTRAGIPLLWPFTDRRFHLLPRPLRVTTGTLVEYLLVLVAVIGVARLWPF
ncbi:MAG TPA: metal-dependent hydrolase [Anaerolineae bacterium]